jgi:hypothetical protein
VLFVRQRKALGTLLRNGLLRPYVELTQDAGGGPGGS